MQKNSFNILDNLQKIGQALVLPIAVLPIAGLLLRFGQPDLLNNDILSQAGLAVFSNLPLLFAIGIAGGISKDRDISAGLAGALSYLILSAVVKAVDPANDLMIFGGFIAGLIGGFSYNAFYLTKLPVFLAFFGGKRFVPIISGIFSFFVALVLGKFWPTVSIGIENLATWITGAGAVGLFFYGVFNRLLIPFGLQHIIEKYAYFALGSFKTANGDVVTGDLARFFAGDPSAGIFMTGFYPIMMFGLPAAALAMYLCSFKENRSKVVGLFASVAFTSLLTGVTEPIEFSFLFVAPILYFLHALFMGLSFSLAYIFDARAGFTFSGGLIDFILSLNLGRNIPVVIMMGVGFFILYFISFFSLIKLLNLKTPGREIADPESDSQDTDIHLSSYDEKAPLYIEALGGKDNFIDFTNCVTRLRLKVKDPSKISEDQIKKLGANGIVKLKDSIQVIIGSDVEFLANAIKKHLG